eukprot:193614_1
MSSHMGMFDVYDNGSLSIENCLFKNINLNNRYVFTYQSGADITFINTNFSAIDGYGKVIYLKGAQWPYDVLSVRNSINVYSCIFEHFEWSVYAIFGVSGGFGGSAVDIMIDNSIFQNNQNKHDYAIYNTPISQMNTLTITNSLWKTNHALWSIKCDYTSVSVINSQWISSTYIDDKDYGIFHIANGHFNNSYIVFENVYFEGITGRGLVAMDIDTNNHKMITIKNSYFNRFSTLQIHQYGASCIQIAEGQNIIIEHTSFISCKGRYIQGWGRMNSFSGAIWAYNPGQLSVLNNLRFHNNLGNYTGDMYMITQYPIEIKGVWNISNSASYGVAGSIYIYYNSSLDWNLQLNGWMVNNITSTPNCIFYFNSINVGIHNMSAINNEKKIIYYGDSVDESQKTFNYNVTNSIFINNQGAIFDFESKLFKRTDSSFNVYGTMFDHNKHRIITSISFKRSVKFKILFEECIFQNILYPTEILFWMGVNPSVLEGSGSGNAVDCDYNIPESAGNATILFNSNTFKNITCSNDHQNGVSVLMRISCLKEVFITNTLFEGNTDCSFEFGTLVTAHVPVWEIKNNIGTVFNIDSDIKALYIW